MFKRHPKSEKASKKRRFAFIILMVLAIFVPLLVVVNRWASTPSEQTIRIATERPVRDPATSTQDIKTDYFWTKVPSNWHVQKNIDTAKPDRLRVVAFAPSGSNGQVGFTSDMLPSDGLAGIGDYHLRITNQATYTKLDTTSFPPGSAGFRSISGPLLYTLFMTHNGRYATIGVSNEVSDEASLSRLHAVVDSWQWQ